MKTYIERRGIPVFVHGGDDRETIVESMVATIEERGHRVVSYTVEPHECDSECEPPAGDDWEPGLRWCSNGAIERDVVAVVEDLDGE